MPIRKGIKDIAQDLSNLREHYRKTQITAIKYMNLDNEDLELHAKMHSMATDKMGCIDAMLDIYEINK